MPVAELLETLAQRSLDHDESYATFSGLLNGELSEVEIAALLAALKTRGESSAEIAGAARAMRDAAVRFPKPDYPVADTCGTGGDGAGTVNLSTAAAFVVAEAGLAVAKHGNRASSSRSGSADLLEALGVALAPPPEAARRSLDRNRLCFLFAPAYHQSVRRAIPVRQALKTRTVFNLLGPLANPAHPEFQVMGVYAPHLCAPVAETLGALGCQAALAVHGSGLDEIALHGPTVAARLRDGGVESIIINPEDGGLPRAPIEQLRGGDPTEGAAWLDGLLAGRGSRVHQHAVALNAGALLWIAGRATTLRQGASQALEVLATGAAHHRIGRLVEDSHGP